MKKKVNLLIIVTLLSFGSYAQTIALQEAGGWLETAYVKWQPVSNADSYNVYYSGEGITDQKIDDPLIRGYGSYIRADIPGLKPGSYTMKVAAVVNGVEGPLATTSPITVQAHDRTGFAFHNGRVPGAYNADGTPKSGAVTLYITEETKNTISLDVVGANSNPCVGLQTILDGFKKGNDTRPLIIRLVGQITDLSYMLNGDIVIENKNNASSYITLEGIGEDATADGWGIRVKNASNIEVRNIGTMNCNSGEGDNIGLQQNNDYVWVHHVDFFYGDAGGDSDQAKGDGALDTKKSTYVTHAYNHFWDSGKSNLLSNGGEDEGYFTYHHNWYDHSDSRHPRVRDHTVHVYNNYFDGISKYGVGATTYSSIFVENNYFRNCKYPMLISEQGTDVFGSNDGTFSGDPGGMIKAYGNYIEGATRFVDQNSFPNDFDAYVVANQNEQIPSSVTSVSGGHAYNNFDTGGSMYSYNPESPSDARNTVMQYAGRMNGGDFQWTFTNSVDDTSYDVNQPLKSALSNYSTSMQYVQGGSGIIIEPSFTLTANVNGSGNVNGTGAYDDGETATLTAVADSGWEFSNWSGDASGTSTSVNVLMDADKTVTATFTEIVSDFTLTANVSGAGTVDCAGGYDNGETATITAIPASGWEFANWSGDASGTNATTSVTMDANKTVTAVFTSTGGSGGDVVHNFTTNGLSSEFFNISGNLSDSKGTVNYEGLTLTQCLKIESSTSITFTSTQESTFTLVFNEGWSGGFNIDGTSYDVSSGVLTLTLAAGSHSLSKDDVGNLYYMSVDYEGGSTTQYSVTTSTSGNGSVTGAGTYDEGSVISLTATADSGYQFDGWSGDASGSDNPLAVTVDSDKSITATFSVFNGTTYDLTTSTAGQGSVSGSGTYPEDEVVQLTATAEPGYVFEGWSGDASGSTNPLSVTMDADKSITATFEEEEVVVGEGYFVATNGDDNNSGNSISDPFATLKKAISVVQPGDYIYIRGGTYSMGDSLKMHRNKSGSAGAMVHVFAYGTETPILQFSDVENSSFRGIKQDAHYWHWKGITIERAGDNGMLLSGNNNIIEKCIFRKNHDTGLQLSRLDTDADEISEWPSNNLIVDCEAYDNADSDSEDADGFAAKLTSGTGNIFRRCVSHHNIDDGWDLYTKSDTGPIGAILFEDCIAHNNGILTNGSTSGGGDKNGFKLGSSAHNIDHELRRCIAYSNGKHGFTDNGNVGNIKFYNLTAYDNGDYNFHTRDNASHTFRNCISFDGNHTDRIVGDAPTSCNALTETDINWTLVASSSDFVTMTPGPDSDPTSNGFLNLDASSPLIDQGCTAPGVSGNGALDLGAIEFGGTPVTQYTISTSSSGNGSVSGAGTYSEGTVISLTATPASGYQFDGWSGAASGSDNPLDVLVDADKSIVANFSEIAMTQYTISTGTNGNGSVSGGGTFDENTTIQLTATPASGYQFDGWSGDASGTDNPLDVLVDSDQSITASFSEIPVGECENVAYQMEDGIISNGTVETEHSGYNGSGFANTDNNSGEWVEITVNVPSAGDHDVTLRYANGSSDRPAAVSVGGSTQISNLSLPGTGAWNSWGTVDFSLALAAGNNTIRYTANGGSGLPNVDETVICQGGSVVTYTLTTSVTGSGSVDPASGTYDDGTTVMITATPASGWQFDGWSGGYTGNPATVAMDSDKNITASFSPIPTEVTITIQENADGFCSVEGSVDNNNGGFTGSGFANTDNSTGNGIDYTVDAYGGSATLVIQYANGASDRPANIIVNGSQQVSGLSFASTGSWTSWASVSTTIALAAGENTIRLEATSGGGLANIDYIEITAVGVSGSSCLDSSRKSEALGSDELTRTADIQVYPNPTINYLTIDAEGKIEKIQIYNLMGVLVRNVNDQFHTIDVSQLETGHYLLRIFTADGTSVHRLHKK